ncbi:MAG TPA: type II toxin-antitoxin system death-on-curing family toxin [Methyloceanibacter sp.]|nr:type II toxin-antitoxin system death-on-curing family toxin [Methyloceanibacter sp.]
MTEPVWLSPELVIAIHDEQLAEFGGASGLRDAGALESAIARPLNQYHYGKTELAALAAAYSFGLSRNHAFVDGNKRTAFLAIVTFLGLNDLEFVVPEPEAVVVMLALAAGEIDEAGLAKWIADKLQSA